ncbi:hypothetical protein DFH06DRAFT_1223003, partial [Mycena polygramma]
RTHAQQLSQARGRATEANGASAFWLRFPSSLTALLLPLVHVAASTSIPSSHPPNSNLNPFPSFACTSPLRHPTAFHILLARLLIAFPGLVPQMRARRRQSRGRG